MSRNTKYHMDGGWNVTNHTVEYWTKWVIRFNEVFYGGECRASITIGRGANGVHITLPNEAEVSIQWHCHVMCSRKNSRVFLFGEPHDPEGSPDAELMITKPDGKDWKFEDGKEVIGYQSVLETREWLTKALMFTH
jgi:hypothetical protein